MPWTIEQSGGDCADGEWAVLKDEDGSTAGCHATEEEAQAQVDELTAAEGEDAPPVAEPVMTGLAWSGVIAVEGETGDDRKIDAGALTWEMLPIPLLDGIWSNQTGHEQAAHVGQIETIVREGNLIMGRGHIFDAGFAQYLTEVGSVGVSIDPDKIDYSVIIPPMDDVPAEGGTLKIPHEVMQIHAGRIRAATAVSIPAFIEAVIKPDAAGQEEVPVSEVVDAELAASTGFEAPDDGDESTPSGMIALRPAMPESLVLPGGDAADQLHVTLQYLGDPSELTPEQADALAAGVAGSLDGPITALVAGHALLGQADPPALVLLLNGDGLLSAHKAVEGLAAELDLQQTQHQPFIPHLTLGYFPLDALPAMDVLQALVGTEVVLDTVSGDVGEASARHLLGSSEEPPAESTPTAPESDTVAVTPGLASEEGDVIVASSAPVMPPKAWFDGFELGGKTPLTVTAEGQVYGHLATWDSCHSDYAGTCVTPPRDGDPDFFHLGTVLTAEGELIPVGRLTVGGGHAGKNGSMRATLDHYDSTSTCAAVVRVVEDQYGIGLFGAVAPDATPEQVAALRRSPLSGDWRKVGGKFRLAAAHAVNVPGFPIPRAGALVASASDDAFILTGRVAGDSSPAIDFTAARERIARSVGRDKASIRASLSARVHGGHA